MCVYINVCVYVCIYIYIYIHTHIYLHIHMHNCTCIGICTCICMYIYIYIYIHVLLCVLSEVPAVSYFTYLSSHFSGCTCVLLSGLVAVPLVLFASVALVPWARCAPEKRSRGNIRHGFALRTDARHATCTVLHLALASLASFRCASYEQMLHILAHCML